MKRVLLVLGLCMAVGVLVYRLNRSLRRDIDTALDFVADEPTFI